MPLDHHPPARHTARIRAMAVEMQIPDAIADQVAAQHTDLDAARAALEERGKTAVAIRGLVATMGLPTAYGETLIADGMSLDTARARIIDAKAATGDQHEYKPIPMSDLFGRNDWTGGPGIAAKTRAAVSALIDPRGASEMGRGTLADCGGSLANLAMSFVRSKGERPMSIAHAVQMAFHGRSDFPYGVAGGIEDAVARGVMQAPPAILACSHEVERETYHSTARSLGLTGTAMPEAVGESGEIRFTTLDETGELLPTPTPFASGLNLSEQLIVNNRVDLLQGAAKAMIEGQVERLRAVLLAPLLANSGLGQSMVDGFAWFNAAHGGNTVTGGGSALGITAVSTSRTKLRRMTDSRGTVRPVEPWGLLVPPELETTAQQLVASIAATTATDANPFSGTLQVITEPGLTNTTAWYLLGNPAQFDGLGLAYLGGQRAPTVEIEPAWTTLGWQMRCVWRIGAACVNPRTWVRSAGA